MSAYDQEFDWKNDMSNAQNNQTENSLPPNKPKKRKGLNIVLNILVYGLCLTLIAGSIMFSFSNDTGKSLFGFRFYHVLTASMKPVFDAGDMIFIKLCDPGDIKTGDVVTFVPSQKSTSYLTHRVMDIIPDKNGAPSKIVTRGDSNNVDDPPIPIESVVGVYQFHIPAIGSGIQFIRENLLPMSICFGSLFLLLAFLRSYFSAKKEILPTH